MLVIFGGRYILQKPSNPSAADVARLAGVSRSAVSRTLRPGGSASKTVRAKVNAAAEALGYHPNAMARAMITRRSDVIGVIMAADTAIYYPEVLKELSCAIGRRGMRTMLFMMESPADASEIVRQIVSYQIDGVVALVALDHKHIEALCDRRVPLVLYNRVDVDHAVSSVTCDHEESGRMLAAQFLKLGHRCFGLIDGPSHSSVGTERMAGVRAALTAAKLETATISTASGDYTYASGRVAMIDLLSNPSKPVTAVIAASDMMALGALDYARTTLGMHVPHDISFAGFDGIGAAGWEAYGLVTMRQPVRHLVEAATTILAERIGKPDFPVERRAFSTRLVGESTVASAPHTPFSAVAA